MGKFLYSNPEYHRYKKQEEITCELLKRRRRNSRTITNTGRQHLSQTSVISLTLKPVYSLLTKSKIYVYDNYSARLSGAWSYCDCYLWFMDNHLF